MKNEHVLVEVFDGVMSLTLNRPESLNAFSPEMYRGLMDAFNEAKQNSSIRAIHLSGAGRAFCAGGDVKTMGQLSPVEMYDRLHRSSDVVLTMAELEQPIIASVHGYAAGIGVVFALASDQIFASNDSKFALSFSRVGLAPDGGAHYFLTRAVGPYRAKELFYKGEPINAQKAYEYGMLNEILPSEQLMQESMSYARALAKGPRRSYGMIKKLVNKSLVVDLKTVLDMERTAQPMIASTTDHKEGVAAFKEKRSPEFKGE